MGGGVANASFTLPVTSAAIPGSDGRQVLGSAQLKDDSGSGYNAVLLSLTTTTANLAYWDSSQNSQAITSTSPFIWTTNDEISIIGTYEAA